MWHRVGVANAPGQSCLALYVPATIQKYKSWCLCATGACCLQTAHGSWQGQASATKQVCFCSMWHRVGVANVPGQSCLALYVPATIQKYKSWCLCATGACCLQTAHGSWQGQASATKQVCFCSMWHRVGVANAPGQSCLALYVPATIQKYKSWCLCATGACCLQTAHGSWQGQASATKQVCFCSMWHRVGVANAPGQSCLALYVPAIIMVWCLLLANGSW